MNLKTVIYALIICSCAFSTAYAENEHNTYLSLSIENDSLGGGTDQFYTSGVRASWFNDKTIPPDFVKKVATYVPTFEVDYRTATLYTIGHNIYTPADITLEEQPEGDRPWAAFLYGSVGLANLTRNESIADHVDELEITIGIVGPEALGKPIQRFVHEYLSNSPEPRGWKNQLDFEPGIILSWQRRIPKALSYDNDYFHARIEPHIGLSIGNIRTHAATGVTFVIGSSPFEDTPARVRPAIPGTGIFENHNNTLDWQLFAGIDGRLVGRDIFLDGNTFSDSHSVDKNYLVGDVSAGASLSRGDYRLSYTINYRTKEFHNQEDESIFGSLTLTKRF